jgi:protein phosphatase
MSPDLLDLFWSGFEIVLSSSRSDVSTIGAGIPLPLFTTADIAALCELAKAHFASQPMVIRIRDEVCIVGDIHGTFHDLARIIHDQGLKRHYLFLGDYVDRGSFSLEVIILLFTLMLRFPGRFILLRGNHELRKICEQYGFRDEILASDYPESVFDGFCEAFAWMPIAAVVHGSYLCVHGGIGPMISSVDVIEAITRPIHSDTDTIVRTILWADPTDASVAFGASGRGSGVTYGPVGVKRFLQANSLRAIIRAHQCVSGVQLMQSMPVCTVFSASNYEVDKANDAGILLVERNKEPTARTFPAIPRMARVQCAFFSHSRADTSAIRVSLSDLQNYTEASPGPRMRTGMLRMAAYGNMKKRGGLAVALTKSIVNRTTLRTSSLNLINPSSTCMPLPRLHESFPAQNNAIPEEADE